MTDAYLRVARPCLGKLAALLLTFVALAAAASGCNRQKPPSTGTPPAPASQTVADEGPLSPRYIRISVYVTDAQTHVGLDGATVLVGDTPLLPDPLPAEYGPPEGLYDTEGLVGGSYLLRLSRPGYRSLAGRLVVPPVPEHIGEREPPKVLELEEPLEAPGKGSTMAAMILWQKYKRAPASPQDATSPARPHPSMPTIVPPGISPGDYPPGSLPVGHPPIQGTTTQPAPAPAAPAAVGVRP